MTILASNCTVIVGAQFGDEGKGKIVDLLAEKSDFVVRFNGGNNAGHTVKAGSKTFKLHLLPSGILKKARNLVGQGVVVDPKAFLDEISELKSAGVEVTPKNLGVDFRCHVVMPWHVIEDQASRKIGTTGRGIGPCYEDKAARRGIRVEELFDGHSLRKRLRELMHVKKRMLAVIGAVTNEMSENSLYDEFSAFGRKLEPFVCDVSSELGNALQSGKTVLFEGAQGTFLDNAFGTYPFVTSSQCISGAASVGAGVPPSALQDVQLVVKAYATRVGNGPFPTELTGKLGEKIREKGAEFGTTTGRPRRVGWLDVPMLRTAVRLNGATGFHLTKLDVLGGLEEILVAEAYSTDSTASIQSFPRTSELEQLKPVFASFEGFGDLPRQEWRKIALQSRQKGIKALPLQAQQYVKAVEKMVGVKLLSVSVGPERQETIWLK